ncbi:hypothetical protein [Streptomyces sp. NPDC004788]
MLLVNHGPDTGPASGRSRPRCGGRLRGRGSLSSATAREADMNGTLRAYVENSEYETGPFLALTWPISAASLFGVSQSANSSTRLHLDLRPHASALRAFCCAC